jgi:1-acyl-sn-glycerol-3-phosphate acyltransferase
MVSETCVLLSKAVSPLTQLRFAHTCAQTVATHVIGFVTNGQVYPPTPAPHPKGYVQVSNHPSWADAFIVSALVEKLPRPVAVKHTHLLAPLVHKVLSLGRPVYIVPGGTLEKAAADVPKEEDVWLAPAGKCHLEPLEEHPEGPGLPMKTGGGVLASLTGRALLPMAIDVNSTLVWKNMVSAASGGAGGVALFSSVGALLLGVPTAVWAVPAVVGAGLLGSAITRWEDHVVARVRYGTPIPVETPKDISPEERKALAKKALHEAAKQINAMVREMKASHSPLEGF